MSRRASGDAASSGSIAGPVVVSAPARRRIRAVNGSSAAMARLPLRRGFHCMLGPQLLDPPGNVPRGFFSFHLNTGEGGPEPVAQVSQFAEILLMLERRASPCLIVAELGLGNAQLLRRHHREAGNTRYPPPADRLHRRGRQRRQEAGAIRENAQRSHHMGGGSSVRSSNPFRVWIRRGSVYDDGVVGRRVKPRCETPAPRSFGHPDGVFLEAHIPWDCRRNCLLGR
jgi:hypothetical protein